MSSSLPYTNGSERGRAAQMPRTYCQRVSVGKLVASAHKDQPLAAGSATGFVPRIVDSGVGFADEDRHDVQAVTEQIDGGICGRSSEQQSIRSRGMSGHAAIRWYEAALRLR